MPYYLDIVRPPPPRYAVYRMSTDSWSVLKEEDVQKILAFYLSTEVFQLMESSCPKSSGKLIPLNDRISFWDTEMRDKSDKSNEVWVLNEDGQWTKLMKIKPIFEVERMFGFWINGKVFVESGSGQLLLYDLENEEFSELGIKVKEGGEDLLQVYSYEESLLVIKRGVFLSHFSRA
ncbi:uncharacterized protein LOC111309528 [Durio zibethinus]|uniref:Uncharacterized protein LOC111309528 n=1 Tax=Durio zibethinus TaxID=66656 RepID=A0A6P6AHM1_DURZI|nr:uncharacterized protein LOC111309528 [Durio zibethinus]